MPLDPKLLAEKLKKVYKAKKHDESKIGTGEDLRPPTFYIEAPKPIKALVGNHFPGRRITEVAGKPNCGKTTLGMLAMIAAQKGHYNKDLVYMEGPINVILIDTEGKFSKSRFVSMGGDPSKLFKIDATTLEEAFFGLEETLKVLYAEDPTAKTLIVFDSLGGTPSNAEAEANADESIQLATAAKVIKRNLRVFVPKWLDKYDIAMIIINTNYANIGSVGRSNSGGDGAEFASAVIMQLSRVGNIVLTKNGQRVLAGITTRASITKNHIQVNEYTLKEIDFEIYAYEIKSIDKFKIKKKSEFVNDDGRLSIVKLMKKEGQVSYRINYDNGSADPEKMTTIDELKDFLDKGNYESVGDDDETEE